MKISPAKRVRNMIEGLEQLHDEAQDTGLKADIRRAIAALERVWKSLKG